MDWEVLRFAWRVQSWTPTVQMKKIESTGEDSWLSLYYPHTEHKVTLFDVWMKLMKTIFEKSEIIEK